MNPNEDRIYIEKKQRIRFLFAYGLNLDKIIESIRKDFKVKELQERGNNGEIIFLIEESEKELEKK